MIVQRFDSEQSWLDARRGKITGTRLKDLVVKRGTEKKIGYYELIAERIALPPTQENAMDRGHRLEDDAIARFSQETGKKVDGSLVMWCREDNDRIAISPDGVISETEAVEVKCLSSALHVKAWLTRQIPHEYNEQSLQYFIVNEKLDRLYFVFYDPRMPKDFFYYEMMRSVLQEQIDEYLELERKTLAEIDEIEKELTF